MMKNKHLQITLWIILMILIFLLGMMMGYFKAVADRQIPNMDCGTLIMRQQIKGWDGYIDVPYDLNQFRNKHYEESLHWNVSNWTNG